jgi:hypothetical protein
VVHRTSKLVVRVRFPSSALDFYLNIEAFRFFTSSFAAVGSSDLADAQVLHAHHEHDVFPVVLQEPDQ